MRCSSCGTDNDAGSKFCMTCGSPLESAETPTADVPAPSAETEAVTGNDLLGGNGAAPSGEVPAASSTPPAFGTSDSGGSSSAPAPSGAPPASPVTSPPSSEWSAAPAAPAPSSSGPASWAPPAAEAPAPASPPAPTAWGAPPAAPSAPSAPAGPGQWGAPPAPAGYGQQPGGYGQQPGGYGQQPGGFPQSGGYPQASGPVGPPDPNGLGVAASRLDKGPMKKARAAFAVAGAILEDGEQVEAVVSGQFEGNPAVLVLTDRNLVIVDDRPWKPTVERLEVNGSLQVQGMQDNRTATLSISTSTRQYVVDQIAAKELAVELAQRIRYRAGS